MEKIYDTIIIGGGPAGAAAAVYAGRKKLNTLLIADNFSGQSTVSDEIDNWIGDIRISGYELAKKLEAHVRTQEDVEIMLGEKVTKIKDASCGAQVETDKNNIYLTRTVIIATGGRQRELGIPGEMKFKGRGVSYCSTCDAPFYRDKTVVVVGGGNSGLEAILDLNSYAKKIYLLLNMEEVTGDPATWKDVKKIKNFELVKCSAVKEIIGEQVVTGVKYQDKDSKQIAELKTDGVFVEIGSLPNSEFVKDLVDLIDTEK